MTKEHHLSDLIGRPVSPDPLIANVSLHSGTVAPGTLFAALPGIKADGSAYIDQAIAAGAAAIIAPEGTVIADASVALVTDPNPRLLFSQVCARFFEEQPQMIAAVTGTNGKTSVAQFTRELWALAGHKAASLGTIGLIAPHMVRSGSLTTADTVTLHRDLAALAENGVTHLCMEASSHGLHQYRLDGVDISVAGFTNLSRDHLDYHGTMEEYLAAKMRLFTELLPRGGTAVLNADIPEFAAMASAIKSAGRKVMGYGHQATDLRIKSRRLLPDGQILHIEAGGQLYEITLPLIGEFQAMNVLCAAGMAIASGENVASVLNSLPSLSPVRGRMELAGKHPSGAPVFVDYAHTPDGLETVLKALRPHTEHKLHVVFGCGGDRDRGKRPMMGKIAADLADHVIVTDDNPRTENPAAIRAEIMAAATGATEIGDRADAIAAAIKALKTGDTLVIAGKGHEQGQIVGTDVRPFDDVSVARAALDTITKQEVA